jgi:hypothetical protein
LAQKVEREYSDDSDGHNVWKIVEESIDESSSESQASLQIDYANFLLCNPNEIPPTHHLKEKLTELHGLWLKLRMTDAAAPADLIAKATRLLPKSDAVQDVRAFAGMIRANMSMITATGGTLSYETFVKSTIETYKGIINQHRENGVDITTSISKPQPTGAVHVNKSKDPSDAAAKAANAAQAAQAAEIKKLTAAIMALSDGKPSPVPTPRTNRKVTPNKCGACTAVICDNDGDDLKQCIVCNFSLPVREPREGEPPAS